MTELALHNDAELAERGRGQVTAHTAHDEIVQGTYWENGKGCFIGCIGHDSSAETVQTLTGFPLMLTKIAENIFEGLPNDVAKGFPQRVMMAPAVGADLSLVAWKFLDWCVRDALDKFGTSETRAGCAAALAVLDDKAHGRTVGQDAADAAARAAA